MAILSKAINGYNQLFRTNGVFRVKSTMIGFDLGFRVKVWHHTDLSSPVPEDPYCESLVDMIQSLVLSVESVMRKSKSKPRFSRYVQKKNICLFSF